MESGENRPNPLDIQQMREYHSYLLDEGVLDNYIAKRGLYASDFERLLDIAKGLKCNLRSVQRAIAAYIESEV